MRLSLIARLVERRFISKNEGLNNILQLTFCRYCLQPKAQLLIALSLYVHWASFWRWAVEDVPSRLKSFTCLCDFWAYAEIKGQGNEACDLLPSYIKASFLFCPPKAKWAEHSMTLRLQIFRFFYRIDRQFISQLPAIDNLETATLMCGVNVGCTESKQQRNLTLFNQNDSFDIFFAILSGEVCTRL